VRQADTYALTGIAATLLRDGKTSHSVFKIPIPCYNNSTCKISPVSPYADYLRGISLFIVDEVSMMSTDQFDAIDRMLRDTRNYDTPFGGKTFVFRGDFQQLLHVIPGASAAMIIEKCVTSSPVWQSSVQVLHLTKNMRLRDESDVRFNNFLTQLGSGDQDLIKQEEPYKGLTLLPGQCVLDDDLR
jgi:hypothetical protein